MIPTTATALRYERPLPDVIDAIVIVGSTCTGKTTLVHAIRAAVHSGLLAGVDVPLRFVTRARRPDDSAEESLFVRKAELQAVIGAAETSMHWSRTLESGHTEDYAFSRPAAGMLPVYAANNAIYEPGNVSPPDALARAVLVGVYAPDEIREQRLYARSPRMFIERPAEAAARLADRSENVFAHVHVVVDNYGSHEADATNEIVAFVRAIAARR